MSNHNCDSFCEEYGCEQMKRKQFNDLSRGNTFTNPKPIGECPMSIFGAGVNQEQPAPKKNDGKPIWETVIEEMKQRDLTGRKKYKAALQSFNGRDSARDLFEEILDASVYCYQLIEERNEMVEVLKQIAEKEKMYSMLKPISHQSDEQIEKSKIATILLKKLGELE